ncbi:hypothetical protein BT93_H1856 [Corymbia citriodora subsp. variegata]|nr:hypothetical protein BT93_H1856 [Corymbia citriodora subsp. variegata]
MECKSLKGQRVLPVFYRVEPREIRGQRESYGKALARHEEKLGKASEKVEKWREALNEAANLSGWHHDHGDETEFIERIVKEISTIVKREPLSFAKYPVGVHCRVEEVMSLLSMGSDDVRMIGIWGTGGLGKTTIAKDVYNSIASQFDGCSFLPNVRETSSKPNGLVHLQKTLLSEILWKENLLVSSVYGGAYMIRDRLCCRKVMLVLDDVDHGNQLNALARECKWFGKGSRIIVTTRDKHLLNSHGINRVYEVKPLDQGEAFELLSSHAFKGNRTEDMSKDHRDIAFSYAKGLPLAIVVLGDLLCGRSRDLWESILKKLAKDPNKDINSVLKISFDALEDNERDIFLDIVCFFKGREREYVTKVLDSCGLDTLIGIQILIERSLLTIVDRTVQMHDLIQQMGQDVVKKECPNNPSKRSRLWCYDDVYEVLSATTGPNNVKGIVLRLQRPAKLHISPSAFTHMRNLKLLIILNARISGGTICLPNDLRWLECDKFHLSTLKFSDGPKKLVCFDVCGSQIKKFGGSLMVQDFNKLKFIVLVQCPWLVCMPDLSCTLNLEKLHLERCKNLEHVHESIAYLGKLRSLSLSGCSNLQSFPDFPVKNEALQEVYAINSGFKKLPASIENLVSLECMYLLESKKLATLPSSIYRLQNLEILQLRGCSKLIKFPKEEEDLSESLTKTGFPKLVQLNLMYCHLPEVEFLENLSCFPCLRILNLSGNNFTNLPKCERLNNLEYLDVSDCQQLQEIPKIPRKLRWLEANNCESLNRVPSNVYEVEKVELYSSWGLDCNGFPGNDLFKLEKFRHQKNCQVVLPGREMPRWLLPNKEGYISFVATRDLYKKIIGVAFCVVFQIEGDSWFQFELEGSVNCKGTKHIRDLRPCESDHVWLEYMESKELWTVDHFGPNDSCHFHVSIRVAYFQYHPSSKVIVKNCGFRLMCEPLENDTKVLLQGDPALLYEVSHEDNPMSTKEESSSEIEYLQNRAMCNMEYRLNMTDFSIEKHRYSSLEPHYRKIRPGREMPKEFILVEDGTISFMASQDLHDKLVELCLCVVFDEEDGKKEASFNIVPYVNGQRRNELSGTLGPFDMDHVWFQLFTPHKLWGVLEGAVDFGQFVRTGTVGSETSRLIELPSTRMIQVQSTTKSVFWAFGDHFRDRSRGRLGTQDASI